MAVSERTRTAALVAPKATRVAPVKPVPVTTRKPLPASGPEVKIRTATRGARGEISVVAVAFEEDEGPPGAVTATANAAAAPAGAEGPAGSAGGTQTAV